MGRVFPGGCTVKGDAVIRKTQKQENKHTRENNVRELRAQKVLRGINHEKSLKNSDKTVAGLYPQKLMSNS